MNVVAFLGAIEIGLIFGLVSVSVFLSFRVLNFPDLTVDGSFPLARRLVRRRSLLSDYGLAMRATGANPRMARAQGVDTARATYIGLALSNGIVALAGAMFAQMNGFADVNLGTGTILVGLAAVIIGEAIL